MPLKPATGFFSPFQNECCMKPRRRRRKQVRHSGPALAGFAMPRGGSRKGVAFNADSKENSTPANLSGVCFV